MNDERANRVARAISAGTVTVSLLFAAAGCGKVFPLGKRPGWEKVAGPRPAAASTSVAAAPAAPREEASHGAPRWTDDEAYATDPADAMPVNVFGEVDGVRREGGKVVGESGFQQHTSVDEGEDGDVAVDPTGRWIVFSSTRHNEAGDIYVQRVDGTSVTQLTNDVARDAYPAFSPDGKWIAFASTRAGNWQVYRMDLDGRNVVQVTSGSMQAIHPSFSPDGTRLVYSALGSRTKQWELWTVNLMTGERKQVGYGLFPSWSPDKTVDRIAYQRARQRGSRWFSLWTMDLVEGEGRRNTEVAVSSNAAIVSPCWSPDGRKLAFTTVVQAGGDDATDGVDGPRGAQQDVWTVDADGANRQRLTDGNGTNLAPAWARDNRVYFVSNRGGNESVWSVQASPVDAFTATAGKAGQGAPAHGGAEAHADTKELAH